MSLGAPWLYQFFCVVSVHCLFLLRSFRWIGKVNGLRHNKSRVETLFPSFFAPALTYLWAYVNSRMLKWPCSSESKTELKQENSRGHKVWHQHHTGMATHRLMSVWKEWHWTGGITDMMWCSGWVMTTTARELLLWFQLWTRSFLSAYFFFNDVCKGEHTFTEVCLKTIIFHLMLLWWDFWKTFGQTIFKEWFLTMPWWPLDFRVNF